MMGKDCIELVLRWKTESIYHFCHSIWFL